MSMNPTPDVATDVNTESDWIDWAGGECPLDAPPVYELRFGDGVVLRKTDPRGYDWDRQGHEDDWVIAYRIAQVLS